MVSLDKLQGVSTRVPQDSVDKGSLAQQLTERI